jgi:hypothetical protein
MKRLLLAIALAGFACAASAQPEAGSAKTFAQHEESSGAGQSYSTGARSFNDVLADTGTAASRTNTKIAAGVTPSVPEPQTYALLLAGLGAIVFVAVRRRRP